MGPGGTTGPFRNRLRRWVFDTMGSNAATMRTRVGSALPGQIRAAFAGLGYASGVIALAVLATAIKFMCNDLPALSFVGQLVLVAREAAPLAAAMIVPLTLVVVGSNLAPPEGPRRIAIVVASTGAAFAACFVVHGTGEIPRFDGMATRQLAILTLLFAAMFEFRHRAFIAAATLLRGEIDSAAAAAQLQTARLEMLRAQIAPHFLFNALANVRRLSRLDRRRAASMLGDLIDYFSASLAHRGDATTLGDEIELVEAYLRIHRIRMGERLAYRVDVASDLRGASLPPMMVLTLVENAIKHGLNPLIEGGRIEVSAARHGTTLRIDVADTGRGLAASEGLGSGLANIRARLALTYGAKAALSIAHRAPHGFVASVHLPLEPPA
jgi:signal transduction histidine kinase